MFSTGTVGPLVCSAPGSSAMARAAAGVWLGSTVGRLGRLVRIAVISVSFTSSGRARTAVSGWPVETGRDGAGWMMPLAASAKERWALACSAASRRSVGVSADRTPPTAVWVIANLGSWVVSSPSSTSFGSRSATRRGLVSPSVNDQRGKPSRPRNNFIARPFRRGGGPRQHASRCRALSPRVSHLLWWHSSE